MVPTGAFAQDVQPAPAAAAPDVAPQPEPVADQLVEFSADQVTYDSQNDVIAATGQVRMSRDGNYLAADRVTYYRDTGKVQATGNVVVMNPKGDKLVGESVDLTDTLREGTIDNLLAVLEGGGRLAATKGTRVGDLTILALTS